MGDVVLTVNGRDYAGWTDVRISRGIEQLSGAFRVHYSERWAGLQKSWPIAPGDACTVSVGGTTVITGYVDTVRPRYDAHSHGVSLTGRDAAGDLVDCSAANSPGTWKNRTLTQIAAAIAKPFGISVKADIDVGVPFKNFSLNPGESAFEAIERLCRYRGVMPVSDGAGNIIITGPGTQRIPLRLIEGENILSADGELSWRDRYSHYTVKGSSPGSNFSTPALDAGPKGEADDPNVTRFRPLIIIAEEPGSAVAFKKRAQWEAAVRRGRAARSLIEIQGWRHSSGLWQPNRIVNVKTPWLQIDADMLIAAVHFSRNGRGTRTKLEVCSPEAFTPQEITQKSGNIWNS